MAQHGQVFSKKFTCRTLFATMNHPKLQDLSTLKNKIDEAVASGSFNAIAVAMEGDWRHANGKTPHIHVVISGKNTMTINKKFVDAWGLGRANLQSAKSADNVITYCRKDGTYGKDHPDPEKAGKPHKPHVPDMGEQVVALWRADGTGQGTRVDWKMIASRCKQGASDFALACEFPQQFAQHYSGMARLRSVLSSQRNLAQLPPVLVLFGGTRTGKSHFANSLWCHLPDFKFIKHNALGNWFDGLSGTHEAAVFEEFRGEAGQCKQFIDFETMLTILDKYPCTLPIKQASVSIRLNRFVFTSPVHPADWYSSYGGGRTQDTIEQFQRRLSDNPDSRIFNTTLKQFVGWDGQPIDDQDWPLYWRQADPTRQLKYLGWCDDDSAVIQQPAPLPTDDEWTTPPADVHKVDDWHKIRFAGYEEFFTPVPETPDNTQAAIADYRPTDQPVWDTDEEELMAAQTATRRLSPIDLTQDSPVDRKREWRQAFDDDDEDIIIPRARRRFVECEADCSDEDDEIENSDDDRDLDGFVVDDDVVEYDSDHSPDVELIDRRK
jgi:hypothetical protein